MPILEKERNNQVASITLLFSLTYMVSYITRINYGAIVSEMVTATGFSKSQLSMALTGSFITYGVGQLISGVCGDFFSPKRLISIGLVLSVLMNLFIPICQNPYQITAVWCLNGFAQSLLWPPLVRLMSSLLSEEDYKRTSTKVSWSSSIGTILIYLIAPLLISFLGWQTVFFFSAVCGVIMILLWNHFCPEEPALDGKQTLSQKGKPKHFMSPLMLCIMLAIVFQGMLRDGVTTWMPSYISETYHLSHATSILTGVLLPLFGVFCIQFASILYIRKFTNPLSCAGIFFFVGALTAFALWQFTGKNAAFSVFFSALLTGCMHGVNLILICMIPPFFKRQGCVAIFGAILCMICSKFWQNWISRQ